MEISKSKRKKKMEGLSKPKYKVKSEFPMKSPGEESADSKLSSLETLFPSESKSKINSDSFSDLQEDDEPFQNKKDENKGINEACQSAAVFQSDSLEIVRSENTAETFIPKATIIQSEPEAVTIDQVKISEKRNEYVPLKVTWEDLTEMILGKESSSKCKIDTPRKHVINNLEPEDLPESEQPLEASSPISTPAERLGVSKKTISIEEIFDSDTDTPKGMNNSRNYSPLRKFRSIYPRLTPSKKFPGCYNISEPRKKPKVWNKRVMTIPRRFNNYGKKTQEQSSSDESKFSNEEFHSLNLWEELQTNRFGKNRYNSLDRCSSLFSDKSLLCRGSRPSCRQFSTDVSKRSNVFQNLLMNVSKKVGAVRKAASRVKSTVSSWFGRKIKPVDTAEEVEVELESENVEKVEESIIRRAPGRPDSSFAKAELLKLMLKHK